MSEESVTRYFAQHPRMIGALFTLFIILTQVGNAAAGSSSSVCGP